MTAKTTTKARSTAKRPTRTQQRSRQQGDQGAHQGPRRCPPRYRVARNAGLSHTKAAQAMGVAPMTLNRLCNGHGIPTAKVTVLFADAVGAKVQPARRLPL